jgi:ribosomal-protein-alanine N-acetyltransferase
MGMDGIDPENAASAMDSMPSAFPADGGEGYAGGGALGGRRAYVFNVCVAPHRRREGLAGRILRAAHRSARDKGVEVMYCHVERGNEGARRLYEKEGYAKEAEESAWVAERLGRPPRILLRKNLLQEEP